MLALKKAPAQDPAAAAQPRESETDKLLREASWSPKQKSLAEVRWGAAGAATRERRGGDASRTIYLQVAGA